MIMLAIDTDTVLAKVERAIHEGNQVVLTPNEFEGILETSPLKVVHRATGIWKELGILGYIGKTTIFDAFKWHAHPFEAKPHAFD